MKDCIGDCISSCEYSTSRKFFKTFQPASKVNSKRLTKASLSIVFLGSKTSSNLARDDALAKEMIGAYIEMGGIQTGLQNQCLELVNNSLRDKNYIERIKGRYVKFKDAIK